MDQAGKLVSGVLPYTYCHLCGEPITGQGQVFRHPDWPPGLLLRVCGQCAAGQPRCTMCNLPVARSVLSASQLESGQVLCSTCSQPQVAAVKKVSAPASIPTGAGYSKASPQPTQEQAVRSTANCLSCGNLVRGRYLEFDGVGPYCSTCHQERQPCDICSAPLTDERSGGQWLLSDGRIMCAHCYGTAVFSAPDALGLYEDMKTVAAQILGLKLNIPTGLALVDRNQLADVIRQQQSAQTTPTKDRPGQSVSEEINHLDPQRTLGLYARRGMRRGIYVQTGLPRLLFLQIAAHEFAHAWQGENCPLLRQTLAHEGFAEWVSYRVMNFFGYQRGCQRMLERDDIYGQGLRWALDLEARCGAQGVLQACRTAVGETVQVIC